MIQLEFYMWKTYYIVGLVQDCSNSSALAMELLQSSTKIILILKWHYSALLFHAQETTTRTLGA